PVARRSTLALGAIDAHVHGRDAQIARYVNTGHGHEADDAWILDVLTEKGRDLFPNRFSDSIRTPVGARHQRKLVAVSTMRQSGLLSTNRSTDSRTDAAWRCSVETRQIVSSAVCQASWRP